MKTTKHPTELSDAEAAAIVNAFDEASSDEYVVIAADALAELRAAVAARREADSRIEAAALSAHRARASWGVIGAQTRDDPPGCQAAVRAAHQSMNRRESLAVACLQRAPSIPVSEGYGRSPTEISGATIPVTRAPATGILMPAACDALGGGESFAGTPMPSIQ